MATGTLVAILLRAKQRSYELNIPERSHLFTTQSLCSHNTPYDENGGDSLLLPVLP